MSDAARRSQAKEPAPAGAQGQHSWVGHRVGDVAGCDEGLGDDAGGSAEQGQRPFACLLLTSGTLGDILGRKKIFLAGLIGFTLSSVICALSDSIGVLLVGRTLQGVCGSIMIPISLALVSAAYPDPAAATLGPFRCQSAGHTHLAGAVAGRLRAENEARTWASARSW